MSSETPLVVIALIQVQSGKEDEAIAAIQEAVPSVLQEDGCESYEPNRDLDNPGQLVVVERWASAAALDAHAEQPHVQALLGKLGPILAGAPTIIRSTAL
jgi:quinol monooxygenase YgiN